MSNIERPFKVKDVADRWECSESHVYNMISQRLLIPFRIGKMYRISRAEVERVECGLKPIADGNTLYGVKTEEPSESHSAHKTPISPSDAFKTFDAIGLEEV